MKKRIILAIVVLIVITEIILRLGFRKDLDFTGTPTVYQYDPILNYVYIPDSKFVKNGEEIWINKQGFIGPDFLEKDSNNYRIAIIGSSWVSGPNHLLEYYSFPPVLEKICNENGYQVQVLNCGVDGGERSNQLLKSIKYQILEFAPDMILFESNNFPLYDSNIVRETYRGVNIFYPYNNVESKEDVKKQVNGFLKYRELIRIIHLSYILRVGIKFYMRYDLQNRATYYIRAHQSNCWHSWGNEQNELPMEQSVKLILDMKEALSSQNISFFLFQYHKNSDIISIARKNKLPLISLNNSFTTDDHYYKDGHLNQNGCEKVAKEIFRVLKENKLIPDKYTQKGK